MLLFTGNSRTVFLSGALLFLSTSINFNPYKNKAVKMIVDGSSLESPTKFYNKFSILKLQDLFKIEVAKIVNAHFTDNLLSKIFTLTKNISRATTATESSRNTLYIPRYSTIRLQRCIKYQGVKINLRFRLRSFFFESKNLCKHRQSWRSIGSEYKRSF